MSREDIRYSQQYEDNNFFYRHVFLPPEMVELVPVTHLMTESEWRNIGIQMSCGWVHYTRYSPDPYVLLFRKDKNIVYDSEL